MKYAVMSYNLFEGAQESYSQLVDFINANNVDILCLQEVNGWHDNSFARLKDFAKKCGLTNYVFGDSNTEFKLATLSKYPLLSSHVYTDGFWHSLIESRIAIDEAELTVFNVHLNPRWEEPRKEEVKQLLTLVKTNEPTLIVGDFNSLSKQDNYTPSLLHELQVRGITKFGRDELEFSVTTILETAGFIDVAATFDSKTATVPSAFNKDKNHEVPLRLDYIFASPSVAAAATSVSVIKNANTDAISDHYPILVNIG